jgi:hypothetical protein
MEAPFWTGSQMKILMEGGLAIVDGYKILYILVFSN